MVPNLGCIMCGVCELQCKAYAYEMLVSNNIYFPAYLAQHRKACGKHMLNLAMAYTVLSCRKHCARDKLRVYIMSICDRNKLPTSRMFNLISIKSVRQTSAWTVTTYNIYSICIILRLHWCIFSLQHNVSSE